MLKPMLTGVCPVCNGSKRQPCSQERGTDWLKHVASYDPETHTVSCSNCAIKGMNSNHKEPLGYVPLDKDGNPCTHKFIEKKLGNCWYQYTCANCGESHQIDSGD